jgi:hypothetical protein
MATAEKEIGKQPLGIRILLAYGAIGPVLFVLVFLIEGAARGGGYDPLRHPISSLSIGGLGWIQAMNFLMVGLSMLAFAVAALRAPQRARSGTWAPLLIGLAGIGLFGAGIFTTDPIYGYPTTAPLALAQFTLRGHLHDGFSILVFLGIPVACLVLCRRF